MGSADTTSDHKTIHEWAERAMAGHRSSARKGRMGAFASPWRNELVKGLTHHQR